MSVGLIVGLKLAWIFVLHFLADWLLQSKYMSHNKSSKLEVLLQHASIHLAVFFIGLILITSFQSALMFALANAVVHGFVDWYLWRFYKISVIIRKRVLIPKEKWEEWGVSPKELNLSSAIMGFMLGFKSQLDELTMTSHGKKIMEYFTKEFKYWDDAMFINMLGFDQMVHAVCLVIIFGLMFL